MKKFLIVLFILLFSSCINFDESINKSNDSTIKEKISANSISSEKEKKKRLEYKHENIEGFQRDNSLYVERMMGDYPNDISTSSNEPYTKDELKNLDYDKNIFLEAFNIRIPNRCKVYSNTSSKNTYVIDFPKSDDYDISINIKKLLEEGRQGMNVLWIKLER